MTTEDKLYRDEFGSIPDSQEERIKFILAKQADNEKFNLDIVATAKKMKKIKWDVLEFTMYKVPKPSARPRFNGRGAFIRTYVPRAAENIAWFQRFMVGKDFPKITTPCYLKLNIFEKTPTGFSKKKKVLAELGIVRPWVRTGDFDNHAKAVADMIQYNDTRKGILEDDSLVVDAEQHLYYSIKPRIEVRIEYMRIIPSP